MMQKEIRFGICLLAISALIFLTGVVPVARLQRSTARSNFDSVPQFAFDFSFKIINQIYDESLQDPNSVYYKLLRREVENMLTAVFNGSGVYYEGVAQMTFSNGSVIANPVLLFGNDHVNKILIRSIFNYYFNNYSPKILDLNMTYIQDEIATPVTLPLKKTMAAVSSPAPASSTVHSSNQRASTSVNPQSIVASSLILNYISRPAANRRSVRLAETTHPTNDTTSHPTNNTTSHPANGLTSHPSNYTTIHTTNGITSHPFNDTITHPTNDTTNHTANGITIHQINDILTHPTNDATTHPNNDTTSHPTNGTTNVSINSTTSQSNNFTTSLPLSIKTTPTQHSGTNTTTSNATYSDTATGQSGTAIIPPETHTTNYRTTTRHSSSKPDISAAPTKQTSTESTTSHVLTESTAAAVLVGGAQQGVPGWAIALLVLAALILLVLLLLLIWLLVWCSCKRDKAFSPYDPIDIPLYSTHSRFELPNGNAFDEISPQSKNRTGMYVVNK